MKSTFMLPAIVLVFTCITAKGFTQQQPADHSGTWKYEVKDTPYGNFSGSILLNKDKDGYKARIVNGAGTRYWARIVQARGNRIVLATNLEDTDGLLSGYFQGDSLVCRLEINGDAFVYKLIAKKVYEDQ